MACTHPKHETALIVLDGPALGGFVGCSRREDLLLDLLRDGIFLCIPVAAHSVDVEEGNALNVACLKMKSKLTLSTSPGPELSKEVATEFSDSSRQ